MATKCPKCQADNLDTLKFCGECGTQLTPGDQPPAMTKTLESPAFALTQVSLVAGKYRITEEIGRGGMGIVYKAEDIRLRRTVALKFLPRQWISDKEARERFIHEAQAASALDHPNICNIHEIEETADGQMYIAMAFYEGESLREKIKREPLRTEEALAIASQVAQGIAKAHQKGIVHRDIKPANILVMSDQVAKIVDFGLAKLAGQVRLTREGATIGTVAYMSPEQACGETVDHRTDIWSLGVVLYEMLSGALPFKGDYDQTLIHSILYREPERLAKLRKDLPAGLENIIYKALSKNPADRYQTMAEMLEDLKAIAEGLKPSRGASLFFRGRILGLRKSYGYPAIAGILVLAALAMVLFLKRGGAIDSIAVLPFVNVSGDPSTEYLSDGIPESLINSLTRLPKLRVVPRNMAFRYKGKDVDAQKIGKDLKVHSVLMGRVFQRGDTLNVQTELVDVLKVAQLWGEQYNRKLADIQAIQEEIATEISDKLRLRLTGAEQRLLTKRYTKNTEAYQLYLKGRYYWNRRTEEAFNRGIQCFNQAIEKDPGFALAWAGLADCYNNLGNLGYLAPRDAFPQAKAAAIKALALDENLAEAHTSLAFTAMCYDWNWQEAEKEFKRAIALNPNYATAHTGYGLYLDSMGRFEEGLQQYRRARELEPLSLAINANLGNVHYYFARQYEQAAKQLIATLEMDPNFALAHHGLGAVYLAKPTLGDALAEAQKAVALEPSSPRYMGLLGMAYAAAGKTSEASKVLDELQELSKRRYIPPTSAANILAHMGGKRDEAFKELERGYEDQSWIMYQLKVNPIFDPLRTDPRFQALLRKMNLPEK